MNSREIIIENRMLGCLYGQAIGDALGLGTEFMSKEDVRRFYPSRLSRYDQIVRDRHRRRWPKGAWTDDTDMMLCVLDGFEDGRFNMRKVASNFKTWFKGSPMGIGRNTYNVLSFDDYEENPFETAEITWELSRRQSAANGGVMRTSVTGLPKGISDTDIEAVCRLTHPDMRCVGSCVISSRIINALVWEQRELSVNEIKTIAARYSECIEEWIDIAVQDDLASLKLDDRRTMGYTLRTLGAALWALFHAPDFEVGLLAIVNEGGDADTNAAVACAMLGAKFGYSSIPAYYISNLHNSSVFHNRIARFVHLNIP